MITLACSACQKKLSVKESLAGKNVKCPGCGQVVPVPAPATAAMADKEDVRTLPPVTSPDAPTAAPAPASEIPTQPPESKSDATLGVKHDPRHDSSLTDFLSPPQVDDELGRLGKYRILAILGHGGMGVVYKGEDLKLKRTVAIKAMLPTLAASASSAKRFLREAELMAAVEHDHVVRIYQIDEERGIPFMAMEFLKGEPLDQRLRREEEMPLDEVLRIGREIAEGLHAAHKTGLIHRDIKPANIWLEDRDQGSGVRSHGGRVKILDFGLARAASQGAGLTQQGAIIGTPAYMAPEQGRGAKVDARCDLFSLGVVLYRLCTGNLPFVGADTVSTLMAVATHEPAAPIKTNKELPRELSDLVMKLLAKDPAERIATASEVVQAIQAMEKKQTHEKAAADKTEAITAGAPHSPRTAGKSSRRDSGETPTKTLALPPRRRSAALIAVGVLGVFGVLALLLTGGAVFYWQTNNGVVIIETNDPEIQVSFDQKDLIFKGADTQDLRVGPGEYGMHVKKGDLEFDTDKPIIVKRGDVVRLKISYQVSGKNDLGQFMKKIAVEQGDRELGKKEVTVMPRFKNSLGMEFALVPKGKSWLGGTNALEGTNEVNMTQDFYLGVYAVTQQEWKEVMGNNPSVFSRTGTANDRVKDISDADLKRFPVEMVHWEDAEQFVQRVNEKVKQDAAEIGWQYRLPTYEQWEYACRGGPMTDKAESAFDYCFEKPSKAMSKQQANYQGSGLKRTCKVGSYPPNRLGLHDMHGNVWQWCGDLHYKGGPARLFRGGCWSDHAELCRAWASDWHSPQPRLDTSVGLRLARVPVGKADDAPVAAAPSAQYALQFQSGQSISVPLSKEPVPTAPFTVEGFLTPALDAGSGPVIALYDHVFINENPRGKTSYWGGEVLSDGGVTRAAASNTKIIRGRRVHVAAVVAYNEMRIFLDGRKISATDLPADFKPNTKPSVFLRLGGNFVGRMEEIRISKVARYTQDFTPQQRFEPDANTLALYHFDEGSGDVLKDSSGNNHHAKIVGAKWVKADGTPIGPPPSASQFALRYDGKAKVEVPDLLLPLEGPLCLEAYMTLTAPPRAAPPKTYGLYRVIGTNLQCHLLVNADELGLHLWEIKNARAAKTANMPAVGQRFHIAGVRTATEIRLYIDGQLMTKVPNIDAGIAKASGPGMTIGFPPFEGFLEEVRVSKASRYDKDFTPAKRFETDADTLALYHFDEGSGDVLKDSSGNNHHGKIVGATWVKADGTAIAPATGYALRFDQNDKSVVSVVTVSDFRLNANDQLTIEATITPKARTTMCLVDTLSSSLHLHAGNELSFNIIQSRAKLLAPAAVKGGIIDPHRTVHVAGVYQGTKMTLFVDGKLAGQKTVEAIPLYHAPKNRLQLGIGYEGLMREVRISRVARYDKNFTPAKRFETDADTLALYHCDEGAGDKLTDSSGNGHHGKIVGAKWVNADVTPIAPPPISETPDAVLPAERAWHKEVAAMAPAEQVAAVAAKLKERNGGIEVKLKEKIDGNAVTELEFVTDNVTDLTPLRALPALRSLKCGGTHALLKAKGKLVDLAPLKDMKLTVLHFPYTKVWDLRPLKDMPLTELNCHHTKVADLKPLKNMKLTILDCGGTTTLVAEFEPLRGMPLIDVRGNFMIERDADILRSIPTLETINGKPAKEFLK
jgi:serine/threonine protein kinase/formylglycine-generating enzyme required for sulfatase activity